MRSKLLTLVVALLATAVAFPAQARERSARELAALDALLGKMMSEVDAQEQQLLDTISKVERDKKGRLVTSNRIDNLSEYRGAGDVGSEPDEAQPVEVGEQQRREREAGQSEIPELPRVSAEVGGVTTPKGRLIVEPTFRYQHSSVNRVSIEGLTILPALLVGVIDVVEADRDTYTTSVAARYGLTNRFEVDVNAPYLWRNDSSRTRKFLDSTSEESTVSGSGNGLGDIEVGMRYQLNNARNGWPYVVGNLRVKSSTGTDPFELSTKATLAGDPQLSAELPTGSGFWSVNPSLTFIYPSDPVVFFGNLGYLWTIEDDKGTYTDIVDGEEVTRGFGKVDPGDAIRFNFGMGLGLNEKASMSLSYSLDSFSETRIENSATKKIAGSDVTIGRLLLGFSLRTAGGIPLNLSIGVGATEDAPDTDVSFRMPVNIFN